MPELQGSFLAPHGLAHSRAEAWCCSPHADNHLPGLWPNDLAVNRTGIGKDTWRDRHGLVS